MKGRHVLLVNRLGGRKFLATLVVGVSTATLTWYGKIDGATYAMVILGTVGSFIGGNVYGKVRPRES